MTYDDYHDWDDGDLGWEDDEDDGDDLDDCDADPVDDDEPDDGERVCRPGPYGPFDRDAPSHATDHEDRDERWYELYFLP